MSVYGFRFSFTPLTGVLFAFPSRYLSAIGSCIVFSLGSWSTRIPAGFPVPRRTQDTAGVPRVSATRLSRSAAPLPRGFPYTRVFSKLLVAVLQPRSWRFGLLPVRSPLLGESLLISFPGLLRWFTSPSVAHAAYFIRLSMYYHHSGLPHSAICGSTDMCSSPQLFAAYHGLHRLTAPRHPP